MDPALPPELPVVDEPLPIEPALPPLEPEPLVPVEPVLPDPELPAEPLPVAPPDWANAAPAASIEITAKRFHHVFCMRKRSR